MATIRQKPRVLLWTAMIVIIIAVLTTILLTNLTLRTIEENLPNKLISELFDLDLILEDLSEVVTAVKMAGLRPTEDNLTLTREKVESVYQRIAEIRDSYVFDNLINASTFHAAVAPAIADLKIWLTEGVSGYGPQSEEVTGIALDRITRAFEKARALNLDSQTTAQRMLDSQRRRLGQFLFNVNLLFILTILLTFCMVYMLVRQGVLERREVAAKIDRNRFETSLRESEARFREVVHNISEVIWLFDVGKQKVIYVSPAYEKIWGRSIERLYSRYAEWSESIHPEDRQQAQRTFEQDLARGKASVREYRIVRPSGTVRWISDRSFPIVNAEGKIIRITGIAEDVTERRAAEESLRASQEKTARSRKMESLGLLAGGVAHDLNNILSGIVSYPELILLDLPENSPLKKPIETIYASGQRAAAIVQDLLTIARGVAITREPLNLNDLVREYLNSPEYENLHQFHTTVSVDTALDHELLNISGSRVHLKKVLMNLVSNAVEAIQGHGNVRVSTRNRYLDQPLQGYDDIKIGEYAVLSISDDGSGIAPDDLSRIFEPFYTRKVMGRSGTGLGLAVVWNVLQDHEGYINVTSDANHTLFDLYFPITRESIADAAAPRPLEALQGKGETVLVVDDMATQGEIACRMLTKLGYQADSVSSGEAAIAHVQAHPVDLMLLDMIMEPGLSGRETYAQILKINPQQKAIIVSGFAETEDVTETQRMGAGQYLRKPLTLERLGIAVKDELSKKTAQTADRPPRIE
ncbi:MAG: PAS domain-containing protein [Desulfobacteraceae bacterium]|nr:PAS domain-containing protein [Desulfobacteraceae bacterium]MBC2752209.1 PAS domain-containing protein [Desulfobacteraceae bacterium]